MDHETKELQRHFCEKALRDRKNELDFARREGEIKGRKEGEILGRKEGEILGRKVGVVQGRKEGEIQLIHILQDLLGQDRSPESELASRSLEDLQVMTADLRKKLPNRG